MNKQEYEAKINKTYNGAVKVISPYLNHHSSMKFHCSKCNTVFYNKAGYMLGKDHQKHICTMPYGTAHGERLLKVRSSKQNRTRKTRDISKRIYQMIIEDYTYKEIASEIKVNSVIIRDHFIAEGLIESNTNNP
ncbi:adenylate kinase [Mesobacillus subterraneus]|uniref:adenylate kinase n=1 Tax=Mesobacillus subterraneus TaxID=285983 RepID=UPI001CFF25EF|nr:adenylate kinase [Mesobacillus subterraneus]WLR56510.1 adenylate kinase [Mesobacillus subterraneus]